MWCHNNTGALMRQTHGPKPTDSDFNTWLAKWMLIFAGGLVGFVAVLLIMLNMIGQVGTTLVLIAAAMGVGIVAGRRYLPKPQAKPEGVTRSPDVAPAAPSQPMARAVPVRVPAPSRRDSVKSKLGGKFHSEVHFYGRRENLELDRGVLAGPLVYAVSATRHQFIEPSLIDAALPIAAPGAIAETELSYWPNYAEITSRQRAVYLDWLMGGRQAPAIQIGYVFIYFYGLERRALIDGQDQDAILRELLRLIQIYGDLNRSFRRYAYGLLWQIIADERGRVVVSEKRVLKAIRLQSYWSDSHVAAALAWFHSHERPVPPELAFVVAKHDHRTVNSVVVRRNDVRFRELFAQRLAEWHSKPKNLKPLRFGKNPLCMRYEAASADLARNRRGSPELIVELPNALAISSQFKPWVGIWEQCVADLRIFDKVNRTSNEEGLSAEAYEALPTELRTEDHPVFATWWEIKNRYAKDDGWSFLPVSDLAQARGMEFKATLTKNDSTALSLAAESMGFVIEPDVRITGRNYKWDDQLTLFIADSPPELDHRRYLTATLLLRAGVMIAEADGRIDPDELRLIGSHIESQLDLTDFESERLDALRRLILDTGLESSHLSARLAEALAPQQRRVIGDFLVGIAASDGVITQHEAKSLRGVYRRLKLDGSELDRLLEQAGGIGDELAPEIRGAQSGRTGEKLPPAKEDTVPVFVLDQTRIRDVLSQTREVAAILDEAMSESEEGLDSTALTTPEASERSPNITKSDQEAGTASFQGMDIRFHSFATELVARDSWTSAELRVLADTHGVMAAGAIEAINEWSQEHLGDWLVNEEADIHHIENELLEQEHE